MPRTAPLRILVVEDHAGLRAQIVAVLAGAGWQVEEASDGRLALQMALQEPPDVLLLAVAPRLAGVEVWLLTADDDEHAEAADNAALPGARKRHLRFPGGHVRPASYVERLQPWLAQGPGDAAEGGR